MICKSAICVLAALVCNGTDALLLDAPPALLQFELNATTERSKATPKLFFLFMVRKSLPSAKIWARFFATAREGTDYEVLVHCAQRELCVKSIKPLVDFEIIETVDSKYCTDLVSPMNALLSAALGRSKGNENDKFIFSSETTVPLKPFAYVQFELAVQRATTSDFCITSKEEWAGELVKSHQWIILHRSHALKAVHSPREIINYRRKGCLDEYWHFHTIFGSTLQMNATRETHEIPGLSGQFTVDGPGSGDCQGHCSTFVYWRSYKKALNNFTEVGAALTGMGGGDLVQLGSHPAVVSTISPQILTVLRKSPFLFARKITSLVVLKDFSWFSSPLLEDHFDEFIFQKI